MTDAYRVRTRNAVLMKDDVGKAKPTVYDLPSEGHAYGRAEPPDLEGAREVTMHWAAHVPRAKPGAVSQDFRKLNKLAAKNNVANAKDLASFRKGTDVKLIPPGPAGCAPKVIPSDVIPSFAYGSRSRPSTPIASVIGGHYAAEYEEVQEASYQKYWDMQQVTDKHRVKLTKATSARISGARSRRAADADNSPRELFKLSKFRKVPSRLRLPPLDEGELYRSQSMPALRAAAAQA